MGCEADIKGDEVHLNELDLNMPQKQHEKLNCQLVIISLHNLSLNNMIVYNTIAIQFDVYNDDAIMSFDLAALFALYVSYYLLFALLSPLPLIW